MRGFDLLDARLVGERAVRGRLVALVAFADDFMTEVRFDVPVPA